MIWESFSTDINLTADDSTYIIFKHSPRCSISNMAKARFERTWPAENKTSVFLINVLDERKLSNHIANHFNITHQSPQVLVIKNNQCVFTESHNGIDSQEILSYLP